MAKSDNPVSYGGSVQNFFDLLGTATRKQGGNLGEAIVLLGRPENADAIDELAGIIARVSSGTRPSKLPGVSRLSTIRLFRSIWLPRPTWISAVPSEYNMGGGWVKVEKKKDGLYVDGKKVLLHLEEDQKSGAIRGYKLRKVLARKNTLHPNIMDALFDYPRMLPEDYKQDSQGRTLSICFFGVIYSVAGRQYVRCLYWNLSAWQRGYYKLVRDFDVQDPAAVSESNT